MALTPEEIATQLVVTWLEHHPVVAPWDNRTKDEGAERARYYTDVGENIARLYRAVLAGITAP